MNINQLKKNIKIVYVREKSDVWNRMKLRKVVSRPLRNPILHSIESRRIVLSRIAAWPLASVYGDNSDLKHRSSIVMPSQISIPALYGHIIYSLVSELRPIVAFEAGSGFGISGMYIASALRSIKSSSFFSFELANYHSIARESIGLVYDRSTVINDNFSSFSNYLNPSVKIDFTFLDALHDYNTIIRDVKNLRGWLSNGSIILIDDISYSSDTLRAWKEVATDENVKFSALINNRLAFIEY